MSGIGARQAAALLLVSSYLMPLDTSPDGPNGSDGYSWSSKSQGNSIDVRGKKSASSIRQSRQRGPGRSSSSHALGSSQEKPALEMQRYVCPNDPRAAHAIFPLCLDGYALIGNAEGADCQGLCFVNLSPDPPANGGVEPVDVTRLVGIEDVKRLVVASGRVTITPARGWAYVNMPVYYASDAKAYDASIQVAGQDVTVHLTPVSWRWTPGDGSASFETDDPGGSWPNATVAHTYLQPAASVTVTATVAWRASFTVAGATYPVEGVATSTTSAPPLRLVEAESVLVN